MIFTQLTQQLRALNNMLSMMSDEQYKTRIEHLGNASIGEHTRHIIEVLQCALTGYQTGVVDYINRKRDQTLQNDRAFAQNRLKQLENQINLPDQQLKMLIEQIDDAKESTVPTTYFREVVYNIEHAIHHLALIKVALIEMKLDIISCDFGMAYATIKFKAATSANN
ncbi:MAG: DinB family protein [Saprospiraceae bacterium]